MDVAEKIGRGRRGARERLQWLRGERFLERGQETARDSHRPVDIQTDRQPLRDREGKGRSGWDGDMDREREGEGGEQECVWEGGREGGWQSEIQKENWRQTDRDRERKRQAQTDKTERQRETERAINRWGEWTRRRHKKTLRVLHCFKTNFLSLILGSRLWQTKSTLLPRGIGTYNLSGRL